MTQPKKDQQDQITKRSQKGEDYEDNDVESLQGSRNSGGGHTDS